MSENSSMYSGCQRATMTFCRWPEKYLLQTISIANKEVKNEKNDLDRVFFSTRIMGQSK